MGVGIVTRYSNEQFLRPKARYNENKLSSILSSASCIQPASQTIMSVPLVQVGLLHMRSVHMQWTVKYFCSAAGSGKT